MLRPSVITVGNFDGVHLGHRALLREAQLMAQRHGGADVLVMAFQEHPLTALKPEQAPPKLMDTAQRMAALLDAGAQRIEWLQPDERILTLSPRQFAERAVELFKPIGWVEGPDFRFGRSRAGDIQALHAFGSELGFEVRIVEPVQVILRDKSQSPVSSSLVRWLVAHGRMADAELCLATPFAVRGEVVLGEQRGRTIGFPTVNLDTAGKQLPADGVYGGEVEIDGRTYLAAISVGIKPTFGRRQRVFEAYLLDFTGELYGATLEVRVLRWLRDQWAFPSAESLVRQMDRDVELLRRWRERGLLDAAAAGAGVAA